MFTLIGSDSFITQDCASDCRNLILYTDDRDDIGTHDLTMKVELLDYPDATPIEVVFSVIIEDPCLYTVLLSPGDQPVLQTKVHDDEVLFTFPEI